SVQHHRTFPRLPTRRSSDLLGRLKTGKEAEVWTVVHQGRAVAAKIYKDRAFRSFKNNADYLEGRKVRNSRTRRAIEKGSRFGREDRKSTRLNSSHVKISYAV